MDQRHAGASTLWHSAVASYLHPLVRSITSRSVTMGGQCCSACLVIHLYACFIRIIGIQCVAKLMADYRSYTCVKRCGSMKTRIKWAIFSVTGGYNACYRECHMFIYIYMKMNIMHVPSITISDGGRQWRGLPLPNESPCCIQYTLRFHISLRISCLQPDEM